MRPKCTWLGIMPSITLYIAPFGLQTPFQVPLSPEGARPPPASRSRYSSVAERIDQLVGELQLQATSNQLAIPPGVSLDLIPAPGLWVLFCLARRTIIPAQVVNNLCKVLANDTSSATVGEFIILPISKTYISSDTLLETLSISGLPSHFGLAHTTPTKYLASIPRCWLCMFVRKENRCSSCVECASRAFHLNRVTCPRWEWTKAKHYIHLGLWIPRVAAPCDLIWDFSNDDPTSKISGVLCSLQPKTKLDASDPSVHDVHPWGDYPTKENWILLEFATEKLLPKQHFRDLQKQSNLAGQSKTYAVIPVHCGSVAGAMLEAVRREGSIGWENFWQERLCTRVSGADGGDDISMMAPTNSPPDYSP